MKGGLRVIILSDIYKVLTDRPSRLYCCTLCCISQCARGSNKGLLDLWQGI